MPMTSAAGMPDAEKLAGRPERLSFAQAGSFLAAYRARLAGGAGTIDLAALTVFDSAGVAALVAAARSAAGNAPPVAVRFENPPAKMRALADLYGVAELLFGAR